MGRIRHPRCWAAGLTILAVVFASAAARAQFGLKLPKFPKKVEKKIPKPSETQPSEESSPEVGASRHDTPELTQISPDSAPPGGSGDIVLTGKKFFEGMNLRISCKGGDPSVEGLKVEDPGRAVAQVRVPQDAQEGPCTPYVQYQAGGSFRISKSSPMPLQVPVTLIGQGEMEFTELMMKMQQAMQPTFGEGKTKKGRLVLTSDSIKYVEEGQTLFAESASRVKDIAEMKMMGESVGGIFRIVFANGKIYNFVDTAGGSSEHRAFLSIKRKLGK